VVSRISLSMAAFLLGVAFAVGFGVNPQARVGPLLAGAAFNLAWGLLFTVRELRRLRQ
jgi:hypothetical protein